MKIAYIVPGFGGKFYCGNCLRDSVIPGAMKESGHEAFTLPLYLPHSLEEFADAGNIPVFFGAVNIYLKQNYKLFRKMPEWLYNFFNSPAILRYAAKKSGSTRAEGLEEMTISMLMGADGNQGVELQQLIDYLKTAEKPDVVHLSNALLIGMAARIKEELNVPVFCTLQDEDVWINAMAGEYREKLWKLMAGKAGDIDAFIAVSRFFADSMQHYMSIPKHKIHVVYAGVNPDAYEVFTPRSDPPVIGFLSRMNEENGFGLLVDAFIILKEMEGYGNVRLKLTGGKTGDDDPFIAKQVKKLQRKNFHTDVEFEESFRTSSLGGFFRSVTLVSVPVLRGEAFGLYQLEALASGIPIVQPALGAFPEIVEATGGGVTYSPNTPEALARKLADTIADKEKLLQMSKNGRKAVLEKFNIMESTRQITGIYTQVLNCYK